MPHFDMSVADQWSPVENALGRHTGAVERATTAIGCDVNKPVKSSLNSEKVKFRKSDCGFFNITPKKIWSKKT